MFRNRRMFDSCPTSDEVMAWLAHVAAQDPPPVFVYLAYVQGAYSLCTLRDPPPLLVYDAVIVHAMLPNNPGADHFRLLSRLMVSDLDLAMARRNAK